MLKTKLHVDTVFKEGMRSIVEKQAQKRLPFTISKNLENLKQTFKPRQDPETTSPAKPKTVLKKK